MSVSFVSQAWRPVVHVRRSTGLAVEMKILSLPDTRFRTKCWHFSLALLLTVSTVRAASETNPKENPSRIPLANAMQIAAAERVFDEWILAYQAQDFETQWRLVHPRVRTWYDKKRWRNAMKMSQRKGGELVVIKKDRIEAIPVEEIPCTEMGHCYRKDMQTVVIVTTIEYGKPPSPVQEYAIMANSDEGWRWGGGTILKLPMGETVVILNRRDERIIGSQ